MKKIGRRLLMTTISTLFFGLTNPGQAETTGFVYNDSLCVDLHVGAGGDGRKYELYRDGSLVTSMQNQTSTGVFYSDVPGLRSTYHYQVKYYTWNEGESRWDDAGSSSLIDVDTYYVNGSLHNNNEWQDKLGRGPVSWTWGTTAVGDLDIYDGTLEVADSHVLFCPDETGEAGTLDIMAQGRLHAEGAAFSTASGAFCQGQISFWNQTEPADPVIEYGALGDVYVTFSGCTGVEISNNVMTSDTTLQFINWGNGNRVINNQGGGRISLFSADMRNCLIQGNQVDTIDPSGNANTVRGNHCSLIDVSGASGIQILENVVEPDPSLSGHDRIKIHYNSTDITIQDNDLLGAAVEIESCQGNTLQGNTFVGSGIELWASDTNVIKQNRITENPGLGVRLEISSYNSIENNVFGDNPGIPIRIGDDYNPSNYNVVAFNHIYGGSAYPYLPAGIEIHGGEGNGVHENISEDYYYGVLIGADAANTWVYNNLFRNNEVNAANNGEGTIWNKPKTAVMSNIVGGPYLGGNYYDDYSGTDADGDKLGDTPYGIDTTSGFASATDQLPLIWVSMPSPTPGPTPETMSVDSGDYDGNGTSEIAIFRRSSGMWSVRNLTRVYFGNSTDALVPADYNGDGTSDIAIFRENGGMWSVRNLTRFFLGGTEDQPVPGDYNDGGIAKAGIFRPSSGLWSIRNLTRVYLGSAGDAVIPGYYNADHAKDIAIFRGSGGMWSVRNITRFYFGASTDALVPGDYNGVGKWEGGIFRGSTGLWSIRNVTRIYLGSTGDWALPADYNGDGADHAAIFRDSVSLWSVRNVTRVYFGDSGDIPVTR
jgi:parallel beta-helix repeat protein